MPTCKNHNDNLLLGTFVLEGYLYDFFFVRFFRLLRKNQRDTTLEKQCETNNASSGFLPLPRMTSMPKFVS